MLFHEGLEQNIFTIGAQYELMAIDAPKTLFWHRLLIICIEMRPINPAINNAKWDRGNHGGEIRGSLPAKRDAGEISKLETLKSRARNCDHSLFDLSNSSLLPFLSIFPYDLELIPRFTSLGLGFQ